MEAKPASGDGMMVTRIPAQQQQGGADCGLFSIAFAFHVLHGDDVEKLCLDQERMRQHLIDCFEKQELSDVKTRRCMPNEALLCILTLHMQ